MLQTTAVVSELHTLPGAARHGCNITLPVLLGADAVPTLESYGSIYKTVGDVKVVIGLIAISGPKEDKWRRVHYCI